MNIEYETAQQQNDTMTIHWFDFFVQNFTDLVNDRTGNEIEKCLR